jgi:hypothetical protein
MQFVSENIKENVNFVIHALPFVEDWLQWSHFAQNNTVEVCQ